MGRHRIRQIIRSSRKASEETHAQLKDSGPAIVNRKAHRDWALATARKGSGARRKVAVNAGLNIKLGHEPNWTGDRRDAVVCDVAERVPRKAAVFRGVEGRTGPGAALV